MRSWILSFATLSLCGALFAQTPIPGTPNTTPPQTTQQINGSGNNSGYIVAPPTITLGNGISPTVITNQDAVQVTVPQNMAVSGSTVQAPNPATVNNAPTANPGTTSGVQQNGQQHFDFVVAPTSDNSDIGGSMSDDTVSLGEVARKYRNGRQISKRTITNADVDALNQQYGGSAPLQDNNSQQQQQLTTTPNGAAIAAPVARPNGPFGQPVPTQNSGGTTGAAQSSGQQTPSYAQPSQYGDQQSAAPRYGKPSARQGANATSDDNTQQQENAAPTTEQSAPKNNDTTPKQEQQLPRSSTSLPLLGTLGALSTLAGILYFKMR